MSRSVRLLSVVALILVGGLNLSAVPVPDREDRRGGVEVDLGNGVAIKFTHIPAGSFQMGSPNNQQGRGDELLHDVEITKPFLMGVFEVTQRQFRQLLGTNPSSFSLKGGSANLVMGLDTDDFPVESATYAEALKFCEKLSEFPELKRLGLIADLPTEAEWEYACRAGTKTVFNFGDAMSPLHGNVRGQAPYGGAQAARSLDRTTKVGSYKPNAWGLYDMHGNVEEWVKDWTGPYNAADKKDPQGPANGGSKQLRGGAWQLDPQYARSASRDSVGADARNNIVGFRVALRFAERGR
jgi:formylglycine-generating enzyme required for sulfatase activity